MWPEFFIPAQTLIGVKLLRMASESILVEYPLRSFLPWLASISLDVAVKGDVVQDLVHDVFIVSNKSYSTKPTVILNFSTPGLFCPLFTSCLINKSVLDILSNPVVMSNPRHHVIDRGLTA